MPPDGVAWGAGVGLRISGADWPPEGPLPQPLRFTRIAQESETAILEVRIRTKQTPRGIGAFGSWLDNDRGIIKFCRGEAVGRCG